MEGLLALATLPSLVWLAGFGFFFMLVGFESFLSPIALLTLGMALARLVLPFWLYRREERSPR